MRDSPNLDDDAVLAGAEIEIPTGKAPPVPHTTRTIADLDSDDIAHPAPLTTDPQAQDTDSIINPSTS